MRDGLQVDWQNQWQEGVGGQSSEEGLLDLGDEFF